MYRRSILFALVVIASGLLVGCGSGGEPPPSDELTIPGVAATSGEATTPTVSLKSTLKDAHEAIQRAEDTASRDREWLGKWITLTNGVITLIEKDRITIHDRENYLYETSCEFEPIEDDVVARFNPGDSVTVTGQVAHVEGVVGLENCRFQP